MLTQIKGLHHVSSLASDANRTNAFFTQTLGLRRVKKTVNHDSPDMYHLYYGNRMGDQASTMTFFPIPHAVPGKRGTGEVGVTNFTVPTGSLPFWADRLAAGGAKNIAFGQSFGAQLVAFDGPDGDRFALIEGDDPRAPWTGNGVGEGEAIRGFHSASLRLKDAGATRELLHFMGYQDLEVDGNVTRLHLPDGDHAAIIDIETLPDVDRARQSAGTVHHIAFAVPDLQAHEDVRKTLEDTGWNITPSIDRHYFQAAYFRTPGGVLFEISTNGPGFDWDEDSARLGEKLVLPPRYEGARDKITSILTPLED
ncbi:dioxygenase protein [Ketogulonicigenium robustum]|uniref:Dioxygenase protein n=1 Tax=Ketogulonicigenium robustum TaxID=92947 RepID=A0A1W6P1S3_9RHOB|nr:VOC family protein [Ketogulonicigenium robustum]ARO15384.1 dioxygenase protein [Ketogulonicigenium robustum]